VASITLKARTLGVESVLRRFLVAASLLPSDTLDAQRELGKAAEVVFGAYVPVRSGRALRGISSDVLGAGVTVTDVARNPQSGYDYIGVTRFGHSVARIFPKHSTGSASTLANGKKKRGALRFSIGGRVLYRASVAGYHPASDWATDALPEVEVAAQGVATRLGRKIESRF
jgi:hypothetical protein